MKTNDLDGDALDWAVAKCMGHADETIFRRLKPDEEGWCIAYSTDWAQGGPIIEWEKITLEWTGEGWNAYIRHDDEYPDGPTPLIAAMRCYVASKLGDEITIPKELT